MYVFPYYPSVITAAYTEICCTAGTRNVLSEFIIILPFLMVVYSLISFSLLAFQCNDGAVLGAMRLSFKTVKQKNCKIL